ncbi:MAG: hypothetical protein IKO36_08945 [Bacteroidaceae bacterium]|nr:hypothetical protein [Bacteroidaceae bacterium]
MRIIYSVENMEKDKNNSRKKKKNPESYRIGGLGGVHMYFNYTRDEAIKSYISSYERNNKVQQFAF